MSDINKCFLIGRLTRDAELKYTATGKPISKFTIAVNEKRKDGDDWVDEASFFDINLWGKQAESLNQYLVKGKQVAIEGKLKQDRWEQDGMNRSRVLIEAAAIQLLGDSKKQEGGTSYSAPPPTTPTSRTTTRPPIKPGYMTPGPAPTPPRAAASRPTAPVQRPLSDDGFEDDIPF
jgi:single-strand DNA-binding protein